MAMANLTTAPGHDGNDSAAASSSASSSASFSCSRFDVFINHRGPDVKDTFASHLYRRLLDHGLSVFLDREELEKGHKFSSQIQQAIGGASVQIAIFSERYAESSWCLNELVFMKNAQGSSSQRVTILPIFFKVDPSEVRHTETKGRYSEALKKLQDKRITNPQTGDKEPGYSSDTIQNWRTTLSYVADLSGFELKQYNGDEGELLDEVLKRVLKNVPKRPLYVAQYPTGLDLKLEEFEKTVLQAQEEQVKPKVVGILGVGGVGKTTLAKAFFNLNSSNYNESAFIINVREMSLNTLRSKLIEGLKLGNIKTECPEEGIQRQPLSCHALIVLDDVNDTNQREVLLTVKGFLSPESLILLTSRDKHVLESHGVLQGSLYYLKGLNILQSKQLFCSYAFNQPHPLPEFADLVDQFVRLCGGLPLSLKVLGALVYGRQYDYWEDRLVRLQINFPKEIEGCFRISYDSLEENDKSIFLDIACFFIGEDRDKAIRIWGNVGLQNLQDKCLLDVDSENKINMHDHIRDLGRKIAKEVMPLRLWGSTTNITADLLQLSSHVISEISGISMVSSSLDFFTDKYRDLSNTQTSQISQIRHLFSNFHFRKLQLVATEEDHLEDILREQKPHLIWLRWYGFSHSSLPDWIPMTKLRVLEMQGNTLNTLWPHQTKVLPLDLKELDISAPLSEIPRSIGQLKYLQRISICNHFQAVTVKRLPDEFCHLRSLKYLIFKGFSKLVSLPVLFGELNSLQLMDLEGASSLLTLPNSFGNLTRLKHLSLRGCENLTIDNGTFGDIEMLEHLDLSSCSQLVVLPPQVAHQRSLQQLYLQETKLKEFPSFIGDLCNLEVLKLSSDLLEVLPLWFGDLKSLKIFSLSSSRQLKSLPDSIELLTQLTHLDIKNGGIEYLPENLLKMNNLESLVVSDCPLRELPFKRVRGDIETHLSLQGERTMNKLNSSNGMCMFWLKTLELSGTEIREVFFEEGVCPNLQRLSLTGCHELRQLGWIFGLSKPPDLDISSCVNVEDLPGFETLVSLETLDVHGCEKLGRIQGLGQLTRLRNLIVEQCHEIRELQGVECLTSLAVLSARGCKKLEGIPGLGQLTKLIKLDIRECHAIQDLQGVECLTSLKWLSVSGCEKLRSIPGLGQFTKLTHLDVGGCRETLDLPGVECLTSLKWLSVSGCKKLRSIPGLSQITNLTYLNVGGCREIQELPGVECLTSLEWLRVSGCEKLRSIPGLGLFTKVKLLDVRGCREIKELPGVECLTSLEWLSVNGCEKLRSIPGLGQFTKLTHLDVGGCREILDLPGVECLTSLKWLSVSGCEKLRSIPGLGQVTNLTCLNVGGCREIQELPGVECLTSLESLRVSRREKLRSIPGLGECTKVKLLDVRGCREIQELLGVECLTSLEWFSVSGCEKLRSIPGLGQFTKLTHLDVGECREIIDLPGVECLTSLKWLRVSGCEKLRSIPGLGQFTKLTHLDVGGCPEILDLPGVECLTSLKWLSVSGCEKLRNIPGLGQFTKLKILGVRGCREIQELPGVECLTSLEWLSVSGCEKLRSIPGLGQFTKLTHLDVGGCHEILDLLGVECLTSLQWLSVSGCEKLMSIPGLGQFTKLTHLDVGGCREIRELPGVECLTSLKRLSDSGCEKLRSIPGLGQFTKLTHLDVGGCCEILELSGVECLTCLEWWNVSECEKLRSIPGLGQLTKLTHLNVGGCREILELQGVECLTSLERLNVARCVKLRSIPWLGQLTKLKTICVQQCREIRELPGVEHLMSLELLDVRECPKLQLGGSVLEQLRQQLNEGLKYEK